VVQGWTTVGGKPVAIAMRRSTYLRESQSLLGFLRWATPSITHDAQSWCDGTQYIDFPFNWLYADDTDIAYCISGRDPVRQSNVDPNLPAWGTGIAEWQGFLPHAAHPHQIGAAKGFLTSWNNKPAPLFSANDGEYGYGLTYRSQSLDDAIRAAFAGGGGHITEAQLVSAMEDAATVDLQGTRVLPELLPYLASQPHSPQVTQMLSRLAGWLAAGAHRVRAHPGDPQYAGAAAVAIMDEFYPRLIEALFNPLFADSTQPNNGIAQVSAMDSQYDNVAVEWANNPNFDGSHLGSAYDGGWDGFLVKAVRTLRGEQVALPYSGALTSRLCGSGPASCAVAIDAALNRTAAELQSLNSSADVGAWTVTQAAVTAKQTIPQYDQIQYTAVGIVGHNPQDWQNRPTQQQVVNFPAHRPRAAAAPGNQGTSVSTNPNTAPPAGAGAGAALVALLAATAALRARRPKRRSR
jgi:acyl-homoserine lactone acylase PvdQ